MDTAALAGGAEEWEGGERRRRRRREQRNGWEDLKNMLIFSLALTVGTTRATRGLIVWIGRPLSDRSMKQTSSRLLFSTWDVPIIV